MGPCNGCYEDGINKALRPASVLLLLLLVSNAQAHQYATQKKKGMASRDDAGSVVLQQVVTERGAVNSVGHGLKQEKVSERNPASEQGRLRSEGTFHKRAPQEPAPLPAAVEDFADIHWRPQPQKYLLAFCTFGRISNEMTCLKRHLRLAAILNRTLLVPPRLNLVFRGELVESWQTSIVIDWRRMGHCLAPAVGRGAVMTFDEYFRRHRVKSVRLETVHCAASGPPSNCVNPSLFKKMQQTLGDVIDFPPMSEYPSFLVKSPLPPGPSSQGMFAAAFGGVKDRVLCVGEMFGVYFHGLERHALDLPRPSSCNNLWRPHRSIDKFIDVFIAKTLGSTFAALHLRRGDFYWESVEAKRTHRMDSGYSQYSPIANVARQTARLVDEAQVTSLFIATDASRVELKLFESILKEESRVTRVVSLREVMEVVSRRMKGNRWAWDMLRLASESPSGIPWVLADKGICERAVLFLGNKASTFSGDINDMRCSGALKRGPDNSTLQCNPQECHPVWC